MSARDPLMPDPVDPYKTLQVDPEAEDEVIQAAYRRLARKYHPDVAPTAEAAVRMAAINAAWEIIGDAAARRAFDRDRAQASQPTDRSGPAAAAGTTGSAGHPGATTRGAPGRPPSSRSTPPPETASPDWTSGRSNQGSGYDESMHTPQGHGAAGPPPGRPSGTVLTFGRYAGWSLGEVARHDLEYIEWLDRAPIGRNYRSEIDEILRSSGRRRSATREAEQRRGLYRRR